MSHMLAFGTPGLGQMMIIAAVALLIFGKRLPEVGRSLGKGIVEFKKGLKGIDDEIESASEAKAATNESPHKFDPHTGKPLLPAGYKFDPMTGKPLDQSHAEVNPGVASESQPSPSAEKTVS